jgi:hypothetical protein
LKWLIKLKVSDRNRVKPHKRLLLKTAVNSKQIGWSLYAICWNWRTNYSL